LGDTVMATPVVRVLKRAFPDSRLTVLTRGPFESFWREFPGVDDVIVTDRAKRHKGLGGLLALSRELRRGGYDAALTLAESFSSAFVLWAAGIPNRLGYAAEGRSFLLTRAVKLKAARRRHWTVEALDLLRLGWGVPPFKDRLMAECPLPKEAAKEADDLLDEGGGVRAVWVAFACGATFGGAKKWPVESWMALRDLVLKNTPCRIALVGSKDEAWELEALRKGLTASDAKRVTSFAGQTEVNVLTALIARCRALVANDSGPMHAAAGVGTPVVGLFGSTSPVWTRPLGQGHRVLYRRAECSPCFLRECPIDLRCLKGLSPENAWDALKPLLLGPKTEICPELLSPEVPP
jgi:heptosyltransferase-2